MKKHSRAYSIGHADTVYGIKTFRPSDKFTDLKSFKVGMIAAAKKCRDREYARGVMAALATITI